MKENAGNIHSRVLEWADQAVKVRPQGDYQQSFHIEGTEIHGRRLWRLPGLRHSTYPGIKEAFAVLKTNLDTGKEDKQYFITNRPSDEWTSKDILNRILLHWDTETGVFGIKDNTFHEDKIRYSSLRGAASHVSLLNFSWNCFYAPIFGNYWAGEPISCRIQFWKDNPEYNPFD